MTSVIAMMGEPLRDPDWTDALEAYVQSAKARDKAGRAFDEAEHALQQREAELRTVYDRLTGKAVDHD
jgi:hypothetical protein